MIKIKIALIVSIAQICTLSAFAGTCPTSITASCTTAQSGSTACVDLANTYVSVDQFRSSCENSGSAFSTSPCSVANLVGSCSIQHSGNDGVVMRFYAPFPASFLTQICTQAGGVVCN